VTGGCRKFQNEKLCNVYSLPSIIRMIKLRRMRWVGPVAPQLPEKILSISGYTLTGDLPGTSTFSQNGNN
jgi:hypothetical protein